MNMAKYLRQHPYRRTMDARACTRRSTTFTEYLRDHQAVFDSSWSEAANYAVRCLRGEYTEMDGP